MPIQKIAILTLFYLRGGGVISEFPKAQRQPRLQREYLKLSCSCSSHKNSFRYTNFVNNCNVRQKIVYKQEIGIKNNTKDQTFPL